MIAIEAWDPWFENGDEQPQTVIFDNLEELLNISFVKDLNGKDCEFFLRILEEVNFDRVYKDLILFKACKTKDGESYITRVARFFPADWDIVLGLGLLFDGHYELKVC